MNLRTRYKKLKQYVEFLKQLPPEKVFLNMTNLEHFRCKNKVLLYPEMRDQDIDEHVLHVAKGKLKDEFSKLIDEYNAMKGRQQLATFKRELLNINPTKIIINEDDIYTMNNLVNLCSFVNNEIMNETFNLEESGVLTYGYEQ